MSARLRDSDGRDVLLAGHLKSGGEGAVYDLADRPGSVAKVYHRPPEPSKADKLAVMCRASTPDLLKIAAWPTSTVHRASDGAVVGLVMPKLDGLREIHRLYSPAHRKQDFPNADWTFMIRTARNLAAAFETIHSHGHVVGDVNQGNVIVLSQALVRFIDCDSFQISANGSRYLCEVGVGHFTPPELQRRPFRGLVRTANHDAFGLAILCFHLLFMGRHPFAGKFHGPGDMPIERAIQEFRFAFAPRHTARLMSPPPFALRLAGVSNAIGALFERAFEEDGVRNGRPAPAEWVRALEALEREVALCTAHRGHKYYSQLAHCPWCEIERSGGPDFFVSLAVIVQPPVPFDLAAVWAQIVRSPEPTVAPPPGTSVAAPSPALLPSDTARWRLLDEVLGWGAIASFGLVGVSALLPIGLALALGLLWLMIQSVSPYTAERRRRARSLTQTEGEVRRRLEEWTHDLGPFLARFRQQRRQLESAKHKYERLPVTYQQDRGALTRRAVESQRTEFLRRYFVDQAHIRGIGPGLTAALASYGIETAADITPAAVQAVPAFGRSRAQRLMKWRASIEDNFRYDPARGAAPADVTALDQQYAARRQSLERTLTTGLLELRRTVSIAEVERTRLRAGIDQATELANHARADISLFRSPCWWSLKGLAALIAAVILSLVFLSGQGKVAVRATASDAQRRSDLSRELFRAESIQKRTPVPDAHNPAPGSLRSSPAPLSTPKAALSQQRTTTPEACAEPAVRSVVVKEDGAMIGTLIDTEVYAGGCLYIVEAEERVLRVVDSVTYRVRSQSE